MKIAVVGMGLIGGSLCRAFHHYTPHKVLGTTRNHKTVEFALSVGAIDEELTDLSEPDVTFIALAASGYPGLSDQPCGGFSARFHCGGYLRREGAHRLGGGSAVL